MSKSIKVADWVHAGLVLISGVLVVVSSSLAYKFDALAAILLLLGGALVLDVLAALVLKKAGVVTDIARLAAVVLTMLALCMVFTGRADLMGYVWFSDLEKGNPAAVAALNTGCGAMGGMLLATVLNIVRAFRKDK